MAISTVCVLLCCSPYYPELYGPGMRTAGDPWTRQLGRRRPRKNTDKQTNKHNFCQSKGELRHQALAWDFVLGSMEPTALLRISGQVERSEVEHLGSRGTEMARSCQYAEGTRKQVPWYGTYELQWAIQIVGSESNANMHQDGTESGQTTWRTEHCWEDVHRPLPRSPCFGFPSRLSGAHSPGFL